MLLRVHRERMNQSPQHLVVHRLGPYHLQEIKGIEEVLQDEGIRRFALLEIIRNNGLRLFRDLDGSILSTPRGLSWALSSDSAALGTTGDVQVAALQGVMMYRTSTNKPRTTHVQPAFASQASPTNSPVTIRNAPTTIRIVGTVCALTLNTKLNPKNHLLISLEYSS